MELYQKTGTINFPNEHAYTRITEFKYLTGQRHNKTTIVFEYPTSEGDPYYPVPRPENAEIYKKYKQLADEETDTYFVGRLATYKYYNMDQVVAQALATYKKIAQDEAAEAILTQASSSVDLPSVDLLTQQSSHKLQRGIRNKNTIKQNGSV